MRRDRLRILVTGIHGDSGQGLVKALRFSRKAVLLHGCDSSESGLGAAFVPWLHLVPPARDRGDYVVRLDQICRKHRLDAVLPSLPVEIDALSTRTDPVTLPSGVPVICLPRTYRDVFDDKLLSYRSLERYVPLAPYADGADRSAVAALVRRSGFPIVVKRRKGRGGESFHCVEREQDLAEALQKTPDPVVQAFIDDAEGEFTVGVFATGDRTTAISFRRRLGRTGSSWFAETVEDSEVLEYARTIARVSGLRGSANIQARKSSGGVRLLEINARFSSLAPARAMAGFRDVEWSIAQALGEEPEFPVDGYRHIRFHRFVHEMVDEGEGYLPVPEWSRWIRGRIVPESPEERYETA
ncbi:MAG TPA: ATP-grasp domain-containing protein [Planctomycetota bacterium]|nr:ATP-grasp domain-containing protein [Planctomycetota bacterium]